MNAPSFHSVDLRQLRALRAVARAGSFHGAGAQLDYTQSAISQQIKALERNVGHQLLERTGAGTRAVPTAMGWVVLRHAEAVLARLDQMAGDLAELDDHGARSVHVGYFQSVGATLLPRVVRQVAETLPDVALVLSEGDCDLALLARVAAGELDLCFALAPVEDELLVSMPLFDDPTVVVTRSEDPLLAGVGAAGAGAGLAVAALRDRSVASFGPSPHQRAVDERLRDGTGSEVAIRADDNATLARLVATGSAVAIMSRLAARDAEADGLRATDVADLPARTVVLARHRERPLSPAVGAVLEIVAEVAAAHAAEQTRSPIIRFDRDKRSPSPIVQRGS